MRNGINDWRVGHQDWGWLSGEEEEEQEQGMGYPWEMKNEGNAQRDEQRRTGHNKIKLGQQEKMQLAHGTELIRQVVLAAHRQLVN